MTDRASRPLSEMRVSALLARAPGVLPCLLRHGFTPLANPTMRHALAPTVTLAQAVRLRGLSEHEASALYAELHEVCACP